MTAETMDEDRNQLEGITIPNQMIWARGPQTTSIALIIFFSKNHVLNF